ncbi:NUDIX domain-containing protein [Candidatus Nomurabacteria bacterium]|nr:NUDIX domain-containing protein [Candidatus Nomurabacteria bacterium]
MSGRVPPQTRSSVSFFRAGIVAVLYNPHTNKFLAGERAKPPAGTWQFPQGGIEENQTPIQAALTEVREETGIILAEDSLLFVSSGWISYELPEPTSFHGRGQTQKWFVFEYLGDATLNNPVDNEFLQVAYMDFDDVVDTTASFRIPAYQQFHQEFISWQRN